MIGDVLAAAVLGVAYGRLVVIEVISPKLNYRELFLSEIGQQ